MEEKKYKIAYQGGIIVHKLVKPRKHSYRAIEKRKFNQAVLNALQSPEETQESIEFWKRYAGTKQYDKMIGMLTTALQVANTMKAEFIKLGRQFRLGDYAPHTTEIKQELFKLNQLTLL